VLRADPTAFCLIICAARAYIDATRSRHELCISGCVIEIMKALLVLQEVKLHNRTLEEEPETECQRLRGTVPAGVLEKFDRLVNRGKKGVAIVRNGVCSECHLRLPSGTLGGLTHATELHVCDNCGRFLYLPENQPLGSVKVAPSVHPKKAPKRPRVRTPAHV
jgi:hypothetical protein